MLWGGEPEVVTMSAVSTFPAQIWYGFPPKTGARVVLAPLDGSRDCSTACWTSCSSASSRERLLAPVRTLVIIQS